MKPEYKIITDIIEKNARVLDVGCDDGTLMEFLKINKNVDIRGIEISKQKVQICISKGLTVIEGNAEFDLKQFPDNSFDFVVLSAIFHDLDTFVSSLYFTSNKRNQGVSPITVEDVTRGIFFSLLLLLLLLSSESLFVIDAILGLY